MFRLFAVQRSVGVRNAIVERRIPFARHVAGRYRSRGIDRDDLYQIALVGLVNAVDRFDPDRGVTFVAFARPTIEGEIKRHFRDRAWAARVPRPMKELHLRVRRSFDELSQELGRTPTIADVASSLGVAGTAVAEAMAAAGAYSAGSINVASYVDPARDDEQLEATGDRLLVDQLLGGLPADQREILRLRYSAGWSQAAIGHRVGVSQMQVSRLLRRSMTTMHAAAAVDGWRQAG